MTELTKRKWFVPGVGIALLLLIIYLLDLVSYIFTPLAIIFTTLAAPIIVAGVLYYLMRPVVILANRYMPKSLAILLGYLLAAGFLTGLVFLIGPPLQRQFSTLIDNIPQFIDGVQAWLKSVQNNSWIQRFQENGNMSSDQLASRAAESLSTSLESIGANIINVISTITNIAVLIVTVPFILFYMLKEGYKLPKRLLTFTPDKYEDEGAKVLKDMDHALSSYIQGQLLVSLCVGTLLTIGYFILGLKYPLVLGLVATVTNVVPFIGPFIGTAPAVIVGLVESPLKGLLVLVVIVIVQQIDSNFISPQVMGRKLDIHPLTVILILLVAANFGGIIGLILGVPVYAVGKTIVVNMYRFILIRRKAKYEAANRL
ncbi:AI-2E family transporter [Sediminibacillus albus]|uniref:Predicted PurR-regulated permease PerM n=1 Tax=Sediminibacillus albus TaxID=407036 RepID=A0A1G8YQM8_9BACI|nr:AI-2E family transporter [Sediminibacillus albus]SDK04340.1 Predicted PurR-regulated permease PerM [Sediminibacillus albus]